MRTCQLNVKVSKQSNLVFYAQSTITVISGRAMLKCRVRWLYTLRDSIWSTSTKPCRHANMCLVVCVSKKRRLPLTGAPKRVVLLQVVVAIATDVAVSTPNIRFAHALARLRVAHIAAGQRARLVTRALCKQIRLLFVEFV